MYAISGKVRRYMIYKVSEKEEEIFCAKQTLTHTHKPNPININLDFR
jgi:hypothetical protein